MVVASKSLLEAQIVLVLADGNLVEVCDNLGLGVPSALAVYWLRLLKLHLFTEMLESALVEV